ncbi:MAG: DUF126 domain-containing protein [Candidatus Aenigmarchaeota archaeon]|nr:DUF126 domain-containing protein [Candidatus Aenigmarchaeota archaeon]
MEQLKARTISKGTATGKVLVSLDAISFYGGVDPDTGTIVEKGHALEGKTVAGKILVFPRGKGSTVGSYTIYRLKKNKVAPLAIINKETEAIVAVGVIISDIPAIDKLEKDAYKNLKTGQIATVDGNKGVLILK